MGTNGKALARGYIDVNGLAVKMSALKSWTALYNYMKKYGANRTVLMDFCSSYLDMKEYGNECYWIYPISDGLHHGTAFILVKEGIVSLPYDTVDKEGYEQFLLEDAKVCDDWASMDIFLTDWESFSDDLIAALKSMRTYLKRQSEKIVYQEMDDVKPYKGVISILDEKITLLETMTLTCPEAAGEHVILDMGVVTDVIAQRFVTVKVKPNGQLDLKSINSLTDSYVIEFLDKTCGKTEDLDRKPDKIKDLDRNSGKIEDFIRRTLSNDNITASCITALACMKSEGLDMEEKDAVAFCELARRISDIMQGYDEPRFTLYDYLDACVNDPSCTWKKYLEDVRKALGSCEETDIIFDRIVETAKFKRRTYSA